MNNNTKVLVGFLIGAGAGLITGLLLAPSRGEETRKMITERSKAWLNDIDGANVEKLSEVTRNALDTITEYVQKIRTGDRNLSN